MLQPCDVGHRVVVRRRTEGGLSDVLGELTVLDGERLVVRTETGDEHEIPLADVVAGKPVPARPARYSEIIALERIGARAWPAAEEERLGGWLLRAADGWTNRANSALPLGEAGIALPDAVLACRDWYGARGLPPKITVPLPVRRDVARHLDATGWTAQPLVLVQTAPVLSMIDAASTTGESARSRHGGLTDVELLERPSTDFRDLLRVRRAVLPAAAEHVLLAVPAVRFAEIRAADGTLLGIARGAVVEDWLHIGLVEVVAEARRRGLARAVSAALASWAGKRGAGRAFLQVEERNEPAVRLYAALGFTTHHTYVTYRLES